MNQLHPDVQAWLEKELGVPFTADKHIHSHQDEVFKIETSGSRYYLKLSPTLQAEYDNLQKLQTVLQTPKVVGHRQAKDGDYLLITELPGKNLVELIGQWPDRQIVETFARAIKQLHRLDARNVFADAKPGDVLLHGDMALPNILVTDAGKFGYIDFGQLSFGAPEHDLADAIWSLQRNLGPAYGQIFLEEYGSVAITPKIQKALAFRYDPSKDPNAGA